MSYLRIRSNAKRGDYVELLGWSGERELVSINRSMGCVEA